jgi:aspartyl-tRNA(Asn)/glutamyl-tRNA(Gln) amidotransferase subunit A
VLCRSVADAVLFTRVVQGPDVHDTQSWNQPNDDVGVMLDEGVAGLKLAVLADSDRATIAPDVLAVYDALLRKLQVAGAELVTLNLPFTLASLASVQACPMLASEAYARYAALAEDPQSQLSAPVRARMLSGRSA